MDRQATLAGLVAGAAAAGGALGVGLGAALTTLPADPVVLGQPAAVWLAAGAAGALTIWFGGAAREATRQLREASAGRATVSVRRHGGALAGMAAAAAIPSAFAVVDHVPAVAAPPFAGETPPPQPPGSGDAPDCAAERRAAVEQRLRWVARVAPDLAPERVEACHAGPSAPVCWVAAPVWNRPELGTKGWLHLRNVARADGALRLAVTGDFAPGESTLGGAKEDRHKSAWSVRLSTILASPPPRVVRFSVGHDPRWGGVDHAPESVVHQNGALAGTRAAQVVLDMHESLQDQSVAVDLRVVARVADHASETEPPMDVDRLTWDRRIEVAVTGVPGLDASPGCQQ